MGGGFAADAEVIRGADQSVAEMVVPHSIHEDSGGEGIGAVGDPVREFDPAALDVLTEDSPDLARHPLSGRTDVLLTPHIAFYSESALADLRRISAKNLCAVLEGRLGEVFRIVPPE